MLYKRILLSVLNRNLCHVLMIYRTLSQGFAKLVKLTAAGYWPDCTFSGKAYADQTGIVSVMQCARPPTTQADHNIKSFLST